MHGRRDENGQTRPHPLPRDRTRRQSRRLGRTAAADRAHAPVARPHGGDRPSDRRRRQIWRAGRVPDRHDQPQDAPARAPPADRASRGRPASTSPRRCPNTSPRAWRSSGFDEDAGEADLGTPPPPSATERKTRAKQHAKQVRKERRGERRGRGGDEPDRPVARRKPVTKGAGKANTAGKAKAAPPRAGTQRSKVHTKPRSKAPPRK